MSVCAVKGCERTDIRARGWCKMHYERWRKHKDLDAGARILYPNGTICKFDSCDRTDIEARGWCGMHYRRWRAHGDPGKVIRIRAYNKLPPGVAAFRTLMRTYRNAAKKRGYEWSLSEYEFRFFTESNCHYCGRPPSRKVGDRYNNGEYIFTGVDRIDNDQGYTWGNCVPACTTCNTKKHAMAYKEFREWILRVATTMPNNPEQKEIWECT